MTPTPPDKAREAENDDETCAQCESFVDWRGDWEPGLICDECKSSNYDDLKSSYLDLLKRHEELIEREKTLKAGINLGYDYICANGGGWCSSGTSEQIIIKLRKIFFDYKDQPPLADAEE